jgi:hypothetical protein
LVNASDLVFSAREVTGESRRKNVVPDSQMMFRTFAIDKLLYSPEPGSGGDGVGFAIPVDFAPDPNQVTVREAVPPESDSKFGSQGEKTVLVAASYQPISAYPETPWRIALMAELSETGSLAFMGRTAPVYASEFQEVRSAVAEKVGIGAETSDAELLVAWIHEYRSIVEPGLSKKPPEVGPIQEAIAGALHPQGQSGGEASLVERWQGTEFEFRDLQPGRAPPEVLSSLTEVVLIVDAEITLERYEGSYTYLSLVAPEVGVVHSFGIDVGAHQTIAYLPTETDLLLELRSELADRIERIGVVGQLRVPSQRQAQPVWQISVSRSEILSTLNGPTSGEPIEIPVREVSDRTTYQEVLTGGADDE